MRTLILCLGALLFGGCGDTPAAPAPDDDPSPVFDQSTPEAALESLARACRAGDVVAMRALTDPSTTQRARAVDYLVALNEATLQAAAFDAAVRARWGPELLAELELPPLRNPFAAPPGEVVERTVAGDSATLVLADGERLLRRRDGRWRVDVAALIAGLDDRARRMQIGSLAGQVLARDVRDVHSAEGIEQARFALRLQRDMAPLHGKLAVIGVTARELGGERAAPKPPALEGKPAPLATLLELAHAVACADSARITALCERSTKVQRDAVHLLHTYGAYQRQAWRFSDAVAEKFTEVGERRLFRPTLPLLLNDLEGLVEENIDVWGTSAQVDTSEARYTLVQRDGRWLFDATSLPRDDSLGFSMPTRRKSFDAYLASLDLALVETSRSSAALRAALLARLRAGLPERAAEAPAAPEAPPEWRELGLVAAPDARQAEVSGAIEVFEEALAAGDAARVRAALDRGTPARARSAELLLGYAEAVAAWQDFAEIIAERFGESTLQIGELERYPKRLPRLSELRDTRAVRGDSAVLTTGGGRELVFLRRDGVWRFDPTGLHPGDDPEQCRRIEALYACAAQNLDGQQARTVESVESLRWKLELYLVSLDHAIEPAPLDDVAWEDYPGPLQALQHLRHALLRADEDAIRALVATPDAATAAAAERLIAKAQLNLRRRVFENAVARKFSWAGAYRFGRRREEIGVLKLGEMVDYVVCVEDGDAATLEYYSDSARFVREDGRWLYLPDTALPELWQDKPDAYLRLLRARRMLLTPELIRGASSLERLKSAHRLLLVGVSSGQ